MGSSGGNVFTPGATHHASRLFKTQATCAQEQRGQKRLLVRLQAMMCLMTLAATSSYNGCLPGHSTELEKSPRGGPQYFDLVCKPGSAKDEAPTTAFTICVGRRRG